jgi:two-component system response regulator FixJ
MTPRPVVVVVDDDPGMSRAIARMVEVARMTPVVFASAEAMLGSAPEAIDCVIADVHLPGMDGIELLQRLDASIPVILVSASEEAEDRVRALPGRPRPFLAKPFAARALLDLLSLVMRRPDRDEAQSQRRRLS